MSNNQMSADQSHRRHITALFSDLCNSIGLEEWLEKEQVVEFLGELHALFKEVISRHGGTVTQIQGDGVYAIFGLQSHEDEGRRAVEAALELHQSVKKLKLGPSHAVLHSGIHADLALIAGGDALSGEHMVVSNAVNIASRLSAHAKQDEILVSEISLGTHRNFFNVTALRFIEIKGVKNAMGVYCVLDRSLVKNKFQSRLLRAQTRFIGRKKELALLATYYQQCQTLGSKSVAIHSAPGAGKTRLLEEFISAREASGCLVLRGYCESYLNAQPMQALLHMLSQILPIPSTVDNDELLNELSNQLIAISPALESHAPTLADILSLSEAQVWPTEDKIINALKSILATLAKQHPVILFIDDWQWADDLTRTVVRRIQQQISSRLLVLRTSRETTAGRNVDITINLQPLSSEHSKQIVEQLYPGVDRVTIGEIGVLAGGNPLFIEELCHSYRHSGVSNSLSMLIESRVSRMPDDLKRLLEQIAILGHVVPIWLVQQTANNVAKLDQQIEQLEKLDLVYNADNNEFVRFKHGITRQVVLDTLSSSAKGKIHLHAAQVIETRHKTTARHPFLEQLAYHYGGTKQYALAADYAEAAGDKAYSAAAMDRARLQYQAALKALSQFAGDSFEYERWMAISRRFGQACMFDTQPQQCAVFQQAVALASERQDWPKIAEAEYWLAYIQYALGTPLAAKPHIERASVANEKLLSDSMQVQLTAVWGQVCALAGDYSAALPALNGALSRQSILKTNPKVAFSYGYSLAAKGMLLGDQGNFDEAFVCFDEAQQITQGPVHQIHGSIISMRAGVCLWQGSWDEAKHYALHGVSIGNETGSNYIADSSEALAGYADWRLNEKTALETISQALKGIEAGSQRIWTSMHFSWLCEMYSCLDRAAEARYCAARALQRARKSEALGVAVVYCALGELAGTNFNVAEDCFRRAHTAASKRSSAREMALVDYKHALYLYKHKQNFATATLLLAPCEQRFKAMGMPGYAKAAEQLQYELAHHYSAHNPTQQ